MFEPVLTLYSLTALNIRIYLISAIAHCGDYPHAAILSFVFVSCCHLQLQAVLAQISAHEKQRDTAELVARWRRNGGPWEGISEEEETRVARLFQLVHEKHAICRSQVPDEYILPGHSRTPIDPALRAAGHNYALAVEDN